MFTASLSFVASEAPLVIADRSTPHEPTQLKLQTGSTIDGPNRGCSRNNKLNHYVTRTPSTRGTKVLAYLKLHGCKNNCTGSPHR